MNETSPLLGPTEPTVGRPHARAMPRAVRIALACAFASPAAALAQPTFNVNAYVTNTPGQAVPVQIVTVPEREVMCWLPALNFGSGQPFLNAGATRLQTSVTCPSGVSRVDVKHIAYSPDVGGGASTAARYRVSVGFQAPGGPGSTICPAEGILAMVTDGAPRAPVMQPFRLDTSGAATNLVCFRAFTTSGIAGQGTDFGGTIYFIGNVVP